MGNFVAGFAITRTILVAVALRLLRWDKPAGAVGRIAEGSAYCDE